MCSARCLSARYSLRWHCHVRYQRQPYMPIARWGGDGDICAHQGRGEVEPGEGRDRPVGVCHVDTHRARSSIPLFGYSVPSSPSSSSSSRSARYSLSASSKYSGAEVALYALAAPSAPHAVTKPADKHGSGGRCLPCAHLDDGPGVGLTQSADRDGRQIAASGGCGVVHPGMQGSAPPAPVPLPTHRAGVQAQAHDLRPAQAVGADPPRRDKQAALRDGCVVGHDSWVISPRIRATTRGLIRGRRHLCLLPPPGDSIAPQGQDTVKVLAQIDRAARYTCPTCGESSLRRRGASKARRASSCCMTALSPPLIASHPLTIAPSELDDNSCHRYRDIFAFLDDGRERVYPDCRRREATVRGCNSCFSGTPRPSTSSVAM
jgi:predicted RNA-binding Zn-ribbon protein involved in translation (DUF1610 family)